MKVSGNDLFVTAMKKEGVDTIFAYPGGMVVNLLDALHDCHSIDLVFLLRCFWRTKGKLSRV